MTRPRPEGGELRLRRAARAVLLTPGNEVLLVRFEFPNSGTRWACPGGGIDAGETAEQALRRELAEECGLAVADPASGDTTDADLPSIGEAIWTRTHIVPFLDGNWDGQEETFHLVRVKRFEPRPRFSWEELRREHLHELRWWHLDEIARTTRAAAERAAEAADEVTVTPSRFVPGELAQHLDLLVRNGPPNPPVDVGI